MNDSNCPSDRELVEFIRDELAVEQRPAIEDHLSHCSGCRTRLTVALERSRAPTEEPAPAELKRIARNLVSDEPASRRIWLPLAAALLVAIGLAAVWNPAWISDPDSGANPEIEGSPTVEPSLRSLPPSTSLELTVPVAGTIATGSSTRFRWQPVPDARRYEFLLVDEIGDVVFEETVARPSIELSRSSLPTEIASTDHYWSVRAQLRDGTTVESEPRPISF